MTQQEKRTEQRTDGRPALVLGAGGRNPLDPSHRAAAARAGRAQAAAHAEAVAAVWTG
ncbi:hypothetical protein [Streptomyces sp. Root431]|uniref:hypothetical protein n=1 Tax=Streptomyces sp. Root431 TaxID=1736535 RepID=UPI000AA2646B|nr:hypothetical protein [Streptomyces sp. Root431]